MLKLLNAAREVMPPITAYSNLKVERSIENDIGTLSFSIPVEFADKELKEENYIQTQDTEYTIKSVEYNNGNLNIIADTNIDELEGTFFESFNTTEQTLKSAIDLALAGTGWICYCDISKRRTLKISAKYTWDIIKQAIQTYQAEIIIDSLNKTITFVNVRGEDKGTYFIDQLNLKSVSRKSDTAEFYTRIIPKGKDGLTIASVNNGVDYLENYQYSRKIKTLFWKDERYTDAESLKEDAAIKLKEVSKPYTAYACNIYDLANMDSKYGILSYNLGDTITLIDKAGNIREKQRIVKIVQYPDNPENNTCELANTTLTFEQYISKYDNASDTIGNITTDNGTVDGDTVDSLDANKLKNVEDVIANTITVKTLIAKDADISGHLDAASARIGTLEATTLTVAQINATYATINNLKAATAKIQTLEVNALTANSAVVKDLTADVSKINALMFGSASGGSLTTEFSNSVVSLIGNAQIRSAQIQNLDVSKLNAGDISTTKFNVKSESGRLAIADNTISIKDAKRVRVQIGKDGNNDYNMYVWDASGDLMFDALGLTAKGVTRKIIRDDVIQDNANINASKLDISSLFTEINGSTQTIKSSKIFVDSASQTLDVAFTNMSTTVTDANANASNALTAVNTLTTTVQTQGTQLTAVQGQISSKVWQQDITTAVDSLQIGGANLLTNLPVNWEYGGITEGKNTTAGQSNKTRLRIIDGVTVNPNTTYTFSIESGMAYGIHQLTSRNGSFIVETGWRTDDTYTFTTSSTTAFIRIIFKLNIESYIDINNIGYNIRLKLEKGNIPTDWTPAPEDNDAAISALEGKTTTLTNNYTSLNQTLNALTATVNNHTSSIAQKADGSTVTTLSNKVTGIQADLNGYKTTVSNTYATKTDFNNLQIGGANLLFGTKKFTGVWVNASLWQDDGIYLYFGVKKRIGIWNGLYKIVNALAGEQYTFSAYVKTTADASAAIFPTIHGADGKAGVDVGSYEIGAVTEWTRVSFTFRITSSGRIAPRVENKLNNGSAVWIYGYKLEKGNKATDWTPAPEDIDSKFENYSTTYQMNSAIDQKADSILLNVSNSMSEKLKDYSTTTQMHSVINQKADSILLNVSGSYVTQSNYNTKVTGLEASLSLKINKDTLVSELNASADVIRLTSNRFSLQSTYTQIDQDGSITCRRLTSAHPVLPYRVNLSDGRATVYGDGGKEVLYITAADINQNHAYENGCIVAGKDAPSLKIGIDNGNGTFHAYYTLHNTSVSGNAYRHQFNGGQAQVNSDGAGSAIQIQTSVQEASINYRSTYVVKWSAGIMPGADFGWWNSAKGQVATIRQDGSYETNSDLRGNGVFAKSLAGFGFQEYAYYPGYALSVNGGSYLNGDINCNSLIQRSDKNLKNHIRYLPEQESSDFIMSLKPVAYTFKDGESGREHHGFYAQDVKESMGARDWGLYVDNAYKHMGTGKAKEIPVTHKGLRYEELFADLIATVQLQNKRIKELEIKCQC